MSKLILIGKKIMYLTLGLAILFLVSFYIYSNVHNEPLMKIKLLDFLGMAFLITLTMTLIHWIVRKFFHKNHFWLKGKYIIFFLISLSLIILFNIVSGIEFWNDGITIIELIDVSLLSFAVVKLFDINDFKA